MNIEAHLKNLINAKGFISIDQIMREVLSANVNSYYKRSNILGSSGDFITSPEISQLFGEIIGLWTIEQWQKLGRPLQINLLELGPGRGSLMRDLLRTAKLVPAFYQSLTVQLLEINPHLISEQKLTLAHVDRPISWLSNIKKLRQVPTILIANEFFDALPIKQYIKKDNLWHELVLKIDGNSDQLKFEKVPISIKLQRELSKTHINADNGAIIEESFESADFIAFIAEHFRAFSGSALIIDYGYNLKPNLRNKNQYNSTLQAVKNHQYYSCFDSLGDADLSSHVDFNYLAGQAEYRGMNIVPVVTQRQFLIKYGIKFRLKLLARNLSHTKQTILSNQVHRLTSRNQMGELFKVFVFNKSVDIRIL